MKIGSDEHKKLFCRDFIASHCRFDPERLAWPDLDAAELERLRGIPFWQEVLYTERRAGAIVAAYAETITDPLVREAVMLQGFEEARHAELLRLMIHRYGVAAEERLPESAERRPTPCLRRFRLWRMPRCISRFWRVQDCAPGWLSAGSDVRDLRDADPRGNPPHRLLHQLDGMATSRAWPRCVVAARCDGSALLRQGDRPVAPYRLAWAQCE